jgi:hypothetical protein
VSDVKSYSHLVGRLTSGNTRTVVSDVKSYSHLVGTLTFDNTRRVVLWHATLFESYRF